MTDIKLAVRDAQKTKLDGAQDISKAEYAKIKTAWQRDPQSAESVKWLEKNNPSLHAALTSDLDYSGFVGTSNGSLNSTRAGVELEADAGRRDAKLNKLPPLSAYNERGLPKGSDGGTPFGGGTAHKTGSNTTMIRDGALDVTPAQAQVSRDKQADLCAKMSGVMGVDVSNPPSVNAAKGYFKTLAANGASKEDIQKEYKNYLDTFYKHPGGVSWEPKLSKDNVNERFADQPCGKDGKRLIDCEGYAALTEAALGDLKDKDGKKMFDVKHASNGGHVFTGVFPAGKGDGGFVVSSGKIDPLPLDPAFTKGPVDRQRDIALNAYNDAGMKRGEDAHAATISERGSSIGDMQPISAKYK